MKLLHSAVASGVRRDAPWKQKRHGGRREDAKGTEDDERRAFALSFCHRQEAIEDESHFLAPKKNSGDI